MSKRVSLLDKIQTLVDELYNESDNNLVLMAIELDDKGYPLGRMQKIRATPGCALGALCIMEESIIDAKQDSIKKIDLAGELSDKISDLFKKMGVEDMGEMEEKLNNITDLEVKNQLKELLKKMKRNF